MFALVPRASAAQVAAVDTSWLSAPVGFPAGAAMQAFVGDPAAQGFYAVRVRVPDGQFVGPVSFQRDVKVVLISGVFALGRGIEPNRRRTQSLDPSHRATVIKAGTAIHGWAGENAVLQIEGDGPLVATPVATRPSP